MTNVQVIRARAADGVISSVSAGTLGDLPVLPPPAEQAPRRLRVAENRPGERLRVAAYPHGTE
ncbi:hypothetical protein ACWD48_22875 [Streptomyces sp. NPDC002519]